MNKNIRFDYNIFNKNFNSELSDLDREKILKIFKKYKLSEVYDSKKEIVISCDKILEKGSNIISGHKIWNVEYIKKVKTPNNLPRVIKSFISDKKLLQLSVEYIDILSCGMASFFCYKGYYLSIIVDLDKMIILDARGQKVF